MFGPTASTRPSRTSTSALGISRVPSNTRALRNTSGLLADKAANKAAGKTETAALKNPSARKVLRNDMLCYQLNLAGVLQSETSQDCRRAPHAHGPYPARAGPDVPQCDLRAPPPQSVGAVGGDHPFRAMHRQARQRSHARSVRQISHPSQLASNLRHPTSLLRIRGWAMRSKFRESTIDGWVCDIPIRTTVHRRHNRNCDQTCAAGTSGTRLGYLARFGHTGSDNLPRHLQSGSIHAAYDCRRHDPQLKRIVRNRVRAWSGGSNPTRSRSQLHQG